MVPFKEIPNALTAAWCGPNTTSLRPLRAPVILEKTHSPPGLPNKLIDRQRTLSWSHSFRWYTTSKSNPKFAPRPRKWETLWWIVPSQSETSRSSVKQDGCMMCMRWPSRFITSVKGNWEDIGFEEHVHTCRSYEGHPTSTGNDFLCSENMGGFWLKITYCILWSFTFNITDSRCQLYGFEYAWRLFFEWLVSSDKTSTKWLIIFSSFQTSPKHVKPLGQQCH